jgi:ATP-dependent exoDNAse (exonuclease V) beta subunit
MNNFLVYKSSAGSGKTYTLISVYLQIVLKEPSRFRNILAITFTNKAANEIKQRIISNLKVLSVKSEDDIPTKYNHLVESLKKSTGFGFSEISERAAKVLTLILHNYGDFAVSTIDSFMHRIIRSFSFDLKLSMNFEVEMDTALLQAETVDSLLSEVGKDNYITDILVKFVQERAESDESWQIERDLLKFSDNLFEEDTFDLLPRLGEFTAEKLATVNKKLNQFLASYENLLVGLGKEAMHRIEGQGIDAEYFSYGSRGIHGFFRKIAEGDVENALEPNSYTLKTINDNVWLSAKAQKKPEGNAILDISDELTQIYRKIEKLSLDAGGKYILYRNIRGNLYPMAVLGELNQRLQAVKKDRNVISISEFNRIIASIVANEPVPFIYERTGERFRHYLIDEFQDTSVLQWNNLLPLVENSLSLGGSNMIVGDGKQAIYRFRNGEVEQFVRLPDIDNPSGNPILQQRAKVLAREYAPNQLDSNFRSKCEVIDFNNRFFEFAATAFLPEFGKVYESVGQKSDPKNTGGFVSIEFFEGEKGGFSDHNCERVLQLVGELTDLGYQPGDITVLSRSNRDASAIASFLNASGVKVVSSESLLLSKSPEVNFLVNFLTFLSDNENTICRTAVVAYLFQQSENQDSDVNQYYNEALNPAGFTALLKRAGYDLSPNSFRGMSLYDTCEELIRLFGLHLKSPVYMQFFLDEVLKYSNGKNAAPAGFLEYWEQKKSKLSVVLPLSPDAVQIMTIHKSKGLEFPIVIYAFADDDVTRLTRKSAWVELKDPDLPELEVAMLKIDRKLEKTRFSEIYTTEYNKTKLDLLNLIYVAFTRAAERLYVLTAKPPKEPDDLKSVTSVLNAFLVSAKMFDPGKAIYTFGGEAPANAKKASVLADKAIPDDFLTSDWRNRLVFAGRAPRVWQAESPGGGQASGNLLHLALSMIIALEDVEPALLKLVHQGYIIDSEVQPLRQNLLQLLEHPDVKPFFDGAGQVLAETEILAPGGKSFRPDRIVFHENQTDVIDYKAGRPLESHKNQIRKYASLLNEMGYPGIRAWLVYLESPVEVVEVK